MRRYPEPMQAIRRSRRLGLVVLAGMIAWASNAARAAPSLHLVEAQDGPLASVMIAAYGKEEPVLLFDPQDADAVRETAALLPFARRCIVRADRTGTTAAALMAEVAGAPCLAVAGALELARALWAEPEAVVVYRDADSDARVRAEGFAAAVGAALLPLGNDDPVSSTTLAPWTPARLFLASDGLEIEPNGFERTRIITATELLRAFRKHTGADPETLILTNPQDLGGRFSPSRLSTISGLAAALHRSPVFPVPSADPVEIETFAETLMRRANFTPRQILLVGDELALRSHRIPDPVLAAGGPEARGGGTIVRVEIFSGIEKELPQQFPVGRIVAENAVYASLSLARRMHVESKMRGKPVIVLANADEIFRLGETIARTTVDELRNVGVPVRSYFRGEITPEVSQQALGQTDVLVWEGHPRDLTLEEGGGIAIERAPGLVVLQGCYTLDRNDPLILIEKGTQAIVATSAAIYSAPGSGFARALFDSMIYEGADLGTAVRDARNYLLALTKLKQARGHREWQKTYRAALAFALWGDPTYRPKLNVGRPDVRPLTWEVDEESLTLTVPRRRLREVVVDGFRASPVPRAMLGGVVEREGESRRAKEMYGTTLAVPPGRTHVCPPADGWTVVSFYAPATGLLTLLAMPNAEDLGIVPPTGTFRFPLAVDEEGCRPDPEDQADVEDEPEEAPSSS